jgi:hypothetical protein
MKFCIILAVAMLCAAIIGVVCIVEHAHSPKVAAVEISKELARKMMGPSAANFELNNTSFLDSYAETEFYVVLEFKSHGTGDKLQEVFCFDASGNKLQVEWSYSVLNNLAKLEINGGAFSDDGNSRIQQKGQGCEMQIALTPVDYQVQAETISRLGGQGTEMLVSVKGHPELKPFRIVSLTNSGDCLAEFSSIDDAVRYAGFLDIKIKK